MRSSRALTDEFAVSRRRAVAAVGAERGGRRRGGRAAPTPLALNAPRPRAAGRGARGNALELRALVDGGFMRDLSRKCCAARARRRALATVGRVAAAARPPAEAASLRKRGGA